MVIRARPSGPSRFGHGSTMGCRSIPPMLRVLRCSRGYDPRWTTHGRQLGRPPKWGPLSPLNSQDFPESDFKNSGALRSLLLGLTTAVSPLDLRLRCGNRRINHFAPMRLQCLQRRDLVYTHQTAVADDIGGRIATRWRALAHSGNPAFRSASRNFLCTSRDRIGPSGP